MEDLDLYPATDAPGPATSSNALSPFGFNVDAAHFAPPA
jgi:hypothetical protein